MAQRFRPMASGSCISRISAGSEYYDLFAVPSGGGAPVNLTNTPDISETGPHFLAGRKEHRAELQAEDCVQHRHCDDGLELAPAKKLTNEQTKIIDGRWSTGVPMDVSIYRQPDLSSGFTDASVFRIDVASGQAGGTDAAPRARPLLLPRPFRPMARLCCITSNQKGGYNNAGLLDVASKKIDMDHRHAMGGEAPATSLPTASD